MTNPYLADGAQSAFGAAQFKKKHAPPPPRRNLYITFVGKGRGWQDSFAVMCGDKGPTPGDGGAQWATIARPLLRGLTVFQGYNPVTLTVDIRFGAWTSSWEWLVDDASGQRVETDIHKLETMWGMFQGAGQPPLVYLNTYDTSGRTTPLIPLTFQQTAGISGSLANANTWPWVITGITWADSEPGMVRNPNGYRVWQEATVTLQNYQALDQPAPGTNAGGWFVSAPGRDTMLLIAEDPYGHALRPDHLAQAIKTSPRNNPMRGSNIRLERKSVRWAIPHKKLVWVPGHST